MSLEDSCIDVPAQGVWVLEIPQNSQHWLFNHWCTCDQIGAVDFSGTVLLIGF